MSENYNDDEIIDSSEDTEKKRNKSEKFCFLCRRPESKAGPMIELPNNIHVCTDCMQKSFNSMNQQFNEGKFNYSDLLNMPNVSMIDLGSFQNPVQQPKKEKKKKKQEKPYLRFSSMIRKKVWMIEVSNSKSSGLSPKKEGMKTTKEDTLNHGLGIGIISSIVSSYNGSLSMEDHGDYFETSAQLFLKKSSRRNRRKKKSVYE